MTKFFKDTKMQESVEAKLTPRQVELMKLITPIVQEYYQSTKPSEDEIEKSLTTNIKELQELMGKILAVIVNEQNKKIVDAVDEADKSPYSSY